jgi:uncharacterized damage-inducible protein DinB
MEISDFKELFNYNHTVWQNCIDVFKQKLSWEDMIKNQEYNRPFPYSNYDSWNAIDDYNLNTTLKINNYLSSLRSNDLWRLVSRLNNDGIRRTTIVRDVLIHVMTEELHHRGEVIAILWQMNFQPPDMGWLSVMKKTDPIWVFIFRYQLSNVKP